MLVRVAACRPYRWRGVAPSGPALSPRWLEQTFVGHQGRVAALAPIGFDVAPGERRLRERRGLAA
jgi:hypothetical protein